MQPIHYATMANHADIVKMLIDNYRVDVHSKDEVCLVHTLLYTQQNIHMKILNLIVTAYRLTECGRYGSQLYT